MEVKDWWNQLDETWQRLFSVNYVIHYRWAKSDLRDYRTVVGNPFDYYRSIVGDRFNAFKEITLEIGEAMQSLPILYAADCQLDDVANVSVMTSLKELDVSNNAIKDWKGIEGMKLTELNIDRTSATSLDFCASFECLEVLLARENAIDDITPLLEQHHLEVLDISYSTPKNLKQLVKLSQLKALHCSACNLSNADFIKYLSKIEVLELSFNELTDISFVFELPQLNYLDVYQNPFQSGDYDWSVLQAKGTKVIKDDFDTGIVVELFDKT